MSPGSVAAANARFRSSGGRSGPRVPAPSPMARRRGDGLARGPLHRFGLVEEFLVLSNDGEPQAESVAFVLGAQGLSDDLLAENGAEVRRHVPAERENPALRMSADELQRTHHVTPRARHRAGRRVGSAWFVGFPPRNVGRRPIGEEGAAAEDPIKSTSKPPTKRGCVTPSASHREAGTGAGSAGRGRALTRRSTWKPCR